jgi:hypothetical protein
MQKSLQKLHRLNLIAASLHALQALAIILLAKNVTFPISVSYLSFNVATQSLEPASKVVYNLPLAWLIVIFFGLSAVFHTIVATVGRRRYEQDLKKGLNRFRWYEYSLSASTMIVAIGILSGVYSLPTLVALFALVMVMNLCGLVMEIHNQTTTKTKWVSYIVGCIAGIVPWIVIGLYFWGASQYGSGQIPTFVYWIYVSIFVLFNCFALNMFLQYKGWGPWKNYVFGEKVYIWLSLIAKSLLAWQVFFGALRP